MHEQRFAQEIQTSHIFFLLPLILALYLDIRIYVLVISLMLIFSLLYHGIRKYDFSIFDRFFASLLIFSNIILCVLGNFALPHFLMVCILIPVSFYFWFQKTSYTWNHSLWHITSAYICIFSILTFYLGNVY